MKTKETFLLIDPPSGWKYGFPKSVTQEEYKQIKNLKEWCINKGYPKEEADSYGDYFHIRIIGDLPFMNKETSTREQAMSWWNDLNAGVKEAYCSSYRMNKYCERSMNYSSLTGKEIEEIWYKETNQAAEEGAKLHEHLKPNQKQFKSFNSELARAYLNKFDSNAIKHFCLEGFNMLSKTDLKYLKACLTEIISEK